METVGDKYMAVSGLPEPCRSHARCIARLALDMMDLAADEVQIDGEPVVRITLCILNKLSCQSSSAFFPRGRPTRLFSGIISIYIFVFYLRFLLPP